MQFVITLARITALEALRERVLWLAALVVIAGMALAQFLQQVAITESREIQTAVLAALLRVSAAFIITIVVIAGMARESSDKVTELLLSFPVSRGRYVMGKFLGYAAVAVLLAFVFAVPLAFYAKPAALLAWAVSLVCELLIVAAVSVFCVLTLSRTTPALGAVAGFYLLSRSMSAIQAMAHATPGPTSFAEQFIARGVDAVALALPALDRMTETEWLLRGDPGAGTLGTLAGQAAVYVALIGAAALFDLYRKNF